MMGEDQSKVEDPFEPSCCEREEEEISFSSAELDIGFLESLGSHCRRVNIHD